MIAIVSSLSRERAALADLCASQGWVVVTCDSVRAATRLIRHRCPPITLVRHQLGDGFSDDVLAQLATTGRADTIRRIVILAAGSESRIEARQISLGADCVLRDPLRSEILLAYLQKFQRDTRDLAGHRPTTAPGPTPFAGGTFDRANRLLQHGGRSTALTPREVDLIDCLLQANGEIVTYETFFSEILNRPFRGDTSNMRVLLGKLARSATRVGLNARDWIEVIPKSGYHYRAPSSANARPLATGGTRRQ